ncbi:MULTISPECIES: DUF3631 domain-containing protein [Bradyrhizobium]|uniref:DUF3631 domain-containing protein n=2 Tax=Bradyrhizobium TaxID=374 RepID=A0ABY0QFA6_9BRAD|nr:MULTISPECIES: DUF3631 domain-containing protein [Bradyrhizobium]SDK15083.1 Protein of unknown function [Bradyrhizobium ottawaense]SEE50391.1 Protein of unknown function [Bradyrhizobium lablabi]
MTGRTVQRRFGERERQTLAKLFRALGTDNVHEAAAARGRIDSLLQQFGKAWGDLISLLGGTPAAIHTDLAHDIAALGSSDPGERANARHNIDELLARHHKSWNDLADELGSVSPEAWTSSPADDPERVNDLLGLVYHLLEEYVALKPHEYVAVSLWILHTHVYSRYMVTPRLALRSPVADCGKTTLLDILSRLTARADKFDSITTAAIYRLIDETHPTLLIDEADNLGLALQLNGKLRAVFNSGHRNGGTVAHVERSSTRRYSTFAPLALALPDMYGTLPRTLNSRCITITMERHSGQRELRRFDVNHPDAALDAAYGQILLWRRDAELNPEPEMPAGMRNRFADNWRPLLSIADSLGWGEQAREAMVIFGREYQDADAKILLLTDIRKVFDAHKADRLPSKILLDALNDLNADWCEFRGVRGEQQPHKLRGSELASMLREFRIRPRTIWPPTRTAKSKSAKGYRRSQFEEVWRAYCADDGTTAHASNIKDLRLVGDGTA